MKNFSKKKWALVLSGILIFLLVFIIIFFTINKSENKTKEMYKNLAGTWRNESEVRIRFYADTNICGVDLTNTILNNVKGSNCTYQIENGIIKVSFSYTYNDEKNEYNIELMPNEDFTELSTNNGAIYKKMSEEELKQEWDEKNIHRKYYTTYHLVSLKNGKKATITFSNANKCTIDFSELNNRSSGNTKTGYMNASYSSGTCTYSTDDHIHFQIEYDGTLEVAYFYYLDYFKKWQKDVLDSGYVMKHAEITFEEDYSKFTFDNGKWVGQTGELTYYFFKENTSDNEENDKISTNATQNDYNSQNESSNNVINSSSDNQNILDNKNQNQNENKKEEDNTLKLKEEAKNKLDKATVTLQHAESDVFKVIVNPMDATEIKVTIGDTTYNYNDNILLRYHNSGDNCPHINLTDKYQNSRTLNPCINFKPVAPKFIAWRRELAPNGVCTMQIKGENGTNLYNDENLTCEVDSKNFKCGSLSTFNLTKGTYNLVLTNKYGVSQLIEVSCQY